MEGTYFANHYSPDVDRPASREFIAKYKKKFNSQVDAAAALTYDSVYLLVNAIERAGKADPKAIRDALAATKDFSGVTGTISYNGSGDPVKGALIIRIENGKFVFDSAAD
jgi:branched-chain amino acid transport system substrate-binding protein